MKKFKTQIIELFGLPRTGKTTGLKAVREFLKEKGYKVRIIRERASVCPIDDKLHPFFNYWTAISLIKEYIEANDDDIDFILADRGIFDAYVWVNFLTNENEKYLQQDFLNLINQNFIISNYFETFYFQADINTIMKREYERQVKKHTGRIMNPVTLGEYLNSFKEIESELKKWCSIKKMDTSTLTIQQTINKICSELDKTIANNVYKQ